MTEPNLNRPEWDRDSPEPPFRRRLMRLGPRTGATELGVTMYEMDAGGAVSPYHAHHANEELLLVLSGRPWLRTPDGARPLEAGDVVAFPRGLAGAHRISNPDGPAARVLILSTMRVPEIAEYPDTGTLLAMTGPAEGKTFPTGSDVPWGDAVMSAMHAGAEREEDRNGGT